MTMLVKMLGSDKRWPVERVAHTKPLAPGAVLPLVAVEGLHHFHFHYFFYRLLRHRHRDLHCALFLFYETRGLYFYLFLHL